MQALEKGRKAGLFAGTGALRAIRPMDRARIAARRNFVRLKQAFMRVVEHAEGQRGHWLRHQVRQANEPVDLWLLRSVVFELLPTQPGADQHQRHHLDRVLDAVFPDRGNSGFPQPL